MAVGDTAFHIADLVEQEDLDNAFNAVMEEVDGRLTSGVEAAAQAQEDVNSAVQGQLSELQNAVSAVIGDVGAETARAQSAEEA